VRKKEKTEKDRYPQAEKTFTEEPPQKENSLTGRPTPVELIGFSASSKSPPLVRRGPSPERDG